MPLYLDASGQLVIRAAPIAGDTAVANPATSNLVDTAPWARTRDSNTAGADFHPAQYYGGGVEDPSGIFIAGNLATNPTFELSAAQPDFAGWTKSLGANCSINRDLATWFPTGGHAGYIAQADGVTTTNCYLFGQLIPCIPGEWYEFSLYTGAHRCEVGINMECYTSAGVYQGTTITSPDGLAHRNVAVAAGGTALSGYQRLWSMGQIPANTAYIRPVIYKLGTLAGATPTNSYAFFANCYIGRATQNQLTPAAYQGPGVMIPDLYVRTLHIGDNQVTLPESVFTSGPLKTNGGVATIATLAISPSSVSSKRLITWSFVVQNVGSVADGLTFYLQKNGIAVANWFMQLAPVNAVGYSAPVAGSYQYTAAANTSDTFTIAIQGTNLGFSAYWISLTSMQTMK